MKPYFSIIVPVYQAEHTLERCVQSVLQQEYRNFQLILIDDGSTDGSAALCDGFASSDSRIHVIHQRNSGVSAARNAGISAAGGEYLLFLDSDDALADNALSLYAQATLQGTVDVVIGSLRVMAGEQESRKIGFETCLQTGNEVWEHICRDSAPFGYAGGKAIRRSTVSKNALSFRTDMKSQEDLDFFLGVYGVSESFHLLCDCLYIYDYTPSKRKLPPGDHLANQLKLLKTAASRRNLSAGAIHSVHARIHTMLYTALYCAVEEGHYSETLDKLLRVKGLTELLRSAPARGEHGFVIRNFAAGRYRTIRMYFTVRNKIRDLVRLFRKR